MDNDLQSQIFPKYSKNDNAVTPPPATTAHTTPLKDEKKPRHLVKKIIITLVILFVLAIAFLAALPSFV